MTIPIGSSEPVLLSSPKFVLYAVGLLGWNRIGKIDLLIKAHLIAVDGK